MWNASKILFAEHIHIFKHGSMLTNKWCKTQVHEQTSLTILFVKAWLVITRKLVMQSQGLSKLLSYEVKKKQQKTEGKSSINWRQTLRSETIFSPLKMMKKAVYFTLRAVFILKIFKFLFRLFGHVKTTW